MTPRLSKRQDAILSFVRTVENTVDVGSDHGYIAAAVLERKLSTKLIASDISAPSLAKTAELLKSKGLDASTRVGDGLDILKPDEPIDQIIIAGMGGAEIIGILQRFARIQQVGHYVFQPMKEIVALRKFLSQVGLRIIHDTVVEDKKFYHIITAVPGTRKYSELEALFGAESAGRGTQDYARWLSEKQKKIQKIIKNMPKSNKKLDFFENCLKNIEKIKRKIKC